jgi:hypothetical protein
VDDIYLLDGPRFMRMAWRLPAYKGVMRMRFEIEQEKRDGSSDSDERKVIPLSAAMVDNQMSGMFDVAKVGA